MDARQNLTRWQLPAREISRVSLAVMKLPLQRKHRTIKTIKLKKKITFLTPTLNGKEGHRESIRIKYRRLHNCKWQNWNLPARVVTRKVINMQGYISTSCISHCTWRLTKCLDVVMFLVLYLLYIVTSDFFFFGLSPIVYDITNRDAVVMFPVKVVHWKINQLWQNEHVFCESPVYIAHLNQNKETFDEHSYVLTWNGKTTNMVMGI